MAKKLRPQRSCTSIFGCIMPSLLMPQFPERVLLHPAFLFNKFPKTVLLELFDAFLFGEREHQRLGCWSRVNPHRNWRENVLDELTMGSSALPAVLSKPIGASPAWSSRRTSGSRATYHYWQPTNPTWVFHDWIVSKSQHLSALFLFARQTGWIPQCKNLLPWIPTDAGMTVGA